MKRLNRILAVLFLVFAVSSYAQAEGKFRVVTTLSSYADITKSMGGDLLDVSCIASPRFDPHYIEAKPSDVLRVKRADLFIHSGLDLEAWRDPLLDASARSEMRTGGARQLDLSSRIQILGFPTRTISRAEGDIHVFGNPHYWLDPRNGLIIAEEIAAKLSDLDSAHASIYALNLDKFRGRLSEKIKEWQSRLEPYRGTNLVGYHDGWVYLMSFSGFSMDVFLEPKPGIPPTPKQIESVISYVRSAKVPAIVQSSFNPSDAAESVAKETGVEVLTLSQGVGDLEESRDYVSMFEYNVSQLLGALKHD